MKWTDVKLSKPGWYWYRTKTGYALIVAVHRHELGGLFANGTPITNMDGQWSDAPIEEPQEG